MTAKYTDLLYTNDDIRPMLSAESKILVAVHPVNEDIIHFDFYGRVYGIFVLNPECRKLSALLGQMTVIHPLVNKTREGGGNDADSEKRR